MGATSPLYFHLLAFIDGDLGAPALRLLFPCFALTSTPANSCNNPLLSSKLTSAATLPVMRGTPGVGENNSSPRVSVPRAESALALAHSDSKRAVGAKAPSALSKVFW
jgi:hypothetical protein